MKSDYITLGSEKMNIEQFVSKVKNYDVELTRSDIYSVIDNAKENYPADVSVILSTVKSTYNISLAC